MKHDNSQLQCFPTRSPCNIVMGYANNRGITNQNFWRTAINSRHHAKYRGNCYPTTGNAGVIFVRYKLSFCFVVVSSYLRLCSAGLCVCVCVWYMCVVCACVCVCACARAFRIVRAAQPLKTQSLPAINIFGPVNFLMSKGFLGISLLKPKTYFLYRQL